MESSRFQIADVLLTERKTLFDPIPRGIQLVSRCIWNHAILITSENGDGIHAHRPKVEKIKFHEISDKKILLRFPGIDEDKRKLISEYACKQLGKKFNWFTFVGLSYARNTRLACTDLIRLAYLSAGIQLDIWMPRDIIYSGFKPVY